MKGKVFSFFLKTILRNAKRVLNVAELGPLETMIKDAENVERGYSTHDNRTGEKEGLCRKTKKSGKERGPKGI